MFKKQIVLLAISAVFSIYTLKAQDFITHKSDTLALEKAHKLMANFQFSEALNVLDSLPVSEFNFLEWKACKASCYLKLGQLKPAKEIYLEILSQDSLNLMGLNQLARIYISEINYLKALKCLSTLHNQHPHNSYYLKKIAELYLKIGDVNQAILFFEKSKDANYKDIESLYYLASIYHNLELQDQADTNLALGLFLDSGNVKLLNLKARMACQKKNYSEVLETVNTILFYTKDTSNIHLKLLGISSYYTEKYKACIYLLNQLVEKEVQSEAIFYYLGLAYKAIDDLDSSTHYFTKAIEEGQSKNLATYYNNLALTLQEQSKYAASIKAFKAAYEQSRDKSILYNLARNYDRYYKDKNTALRYYQMYLAQADSGEPLYKNYSKHRISALKQIIHFDIDTLEHGNIH